MRRFVLTTQIDSPVSRVWSALCDPSQVVQWDSGVYAVDNPPVDYPQSGQKVRWRYRSERWPELLDLPQEVVPEQKLRSILHLGPYKMDETYELTPAAGGTTLRTTVDLTIQTRIFGALLERLWAGREVHKGFEASLKGLRRYCESTAYRGDQDG